MRFRCLEKNIFVMRSVRFVILLVFFVFCGTFFIYGQNTQTNTLEEILARIVTLLSESRYDEAINLFDTIPQPDGNASHVRLLKASVLSSGGKYNEARTIAEAVCAAEPQNIEALFVLAAIEGATERYRQQQAALIKIINLQSDNEEALIALGNLSLRTRAFRPAASYFDKVLAKNPTNPDALLGLARAFRMNSEWENAEILLNRTIQLYPDMVEARSERARFYLGRGFLINALEDLDEAKKLAPNDYWIALDRASLLLEMNRRDEALEEYNRVISINPNEYLPYVYTAGLKDDLGDHNGAERDYATLARLKPDYVYAFEGLGFHRMRNKKWIEARNAFAEAYRQAPEESLYALLSAISWMRMGDISSPRQFIAQVQVKLTRDTLEWHMFRLYYDLTARSYVGESDMVMRLDAEKDQDLKARMLFYMAMYYDLRGNIALANKYFLLLYEMDRRAIPEWRLNDWILTERNLKPF